MDEKRFVEILNDNLDTRFELFEKKLDAKLDTRFEAFEKKLNNNLDARFDAFEKKMDARFDKERNAREVFEALVQKQFERINEKHDNDFKILNQKIDSLIQQNLVFNQKLMSHDFRITQLESKAN